MRAFRLAFLSKCGLNQWPASRSDDFRSHSRDEALRKRAFPPDCRKHKKGVVVIMAEDGVQLLKSPA